MSDVFISYSRKDKAFVERLHDALKAQDRETWIDWQDIPLSADWWQEIERGIEGANTFVFVISPDSVKSEVCDREINHAVKHNKRLLPIVYREGFEQPHPALAKHNWLFLRKIDAFDRGFADLMGAIDTDLKYVKAHTRLLERAIEWDQQTRNESFLLRGVDLEAAEAWLLQGASKQPQPTQLQTEYISASRKSETEQQKKEARRKRVFTIGIGIFSLFACGAAAVAFYQQQIATAEKQRAEQQSKLNQIRQLATEAFTKENLGNIPDLIRFKPESPMEVQVGLAVISDRLPASLKQLQAKVIRLNPDGRSIVLVTRDRKGFFIDEAKRATRIPAQEIIDAGFTSDGGNLVVTEQSGKVSVFSQAMVELFTVSTAKLNVSNQSQIVTGTAYNPDGVTLAIASSDGNVRVVSGIDETSITLEHDASVNSVTFDSSGKYILTTSGNAAYVWVIEGKGRHDGSPDARHGKRIAKLLHSTPVRFAVFTEDRSIATVSGDIVIRFSAKCDWLRDYINRDPNADRKEKHLCNNQSYLDTLDTAIEFLPRTASGIGTAILLFITSRISSKIRKMKFEMDP